MPHKHNEGRWHKIPKQKFKVANWATYNESLRRRGDLTVWISDEAISQWLAPRRKSRGGQTKYSDLAITMCLTLRVVYDQPLRQTQGMMRSIAKLMRIAVSVPDFSTLSHRGKGLVLPSRRTGTRPSGPVRLVVDNTGLKVFGEGEWLESKHKIKVKHKRWRKLHLGLDLVSGEIICSELTMDDVGDPTALPDLIDQIDGPVTKFIADGAYDGSPTRGLLETRLGEIVEVIIPPPKTAVQSPQSAHNPTVRDRHIAEIETRGRMAWQKSIGKETVFLEGAKDEKTAASNSGLATPKATYGRLHKLCWGKTERCTNRAASIGSPPTLAALKEAGHTCGRGEEDHARTACFPEYGWQNPGLRRD